MYTPKRHKKKKCREDLRRHFMKRMSERYHINLTDHEYSALNKMRHLMEVVKVISNTRNVYRFKYNGKIVYAVYNKTLEGFVTALPENCREADYDTSD